MLVHRLPLAFCCSDHAADGRAELKPWRPLPRFTSCKPPNTLAACSCHSTSMSTCCGAHDRAASTDYIIFLPGRYQETCDWPRTIEAATALPAPYRDGTRNSGIRLTVAGAIKIKPLGFLPGHLSTSIPSCIAMRAIGLSHMVDVGRSRRGACDHRCCQPIRALFDPKRATTKRRWRRSARPSCMARPPVSSGRHPADSAIIYRLWVEILHRLT